MESVYRWRHMLNCLCPWFCKSQELIMSKDKTIRISCMTRTCTAHDFSLNLMISMAWKMVSVCGSECTEIVHPRESSKGGSPYIGFTWQHQAPSSFSEGSQANPKDPGHCPQTIQKLPKQTVVQTAASVGSLRKLCSLTSRRFLSFIQDCLMQQPKNREQNLGYPQSCLMTWREIQISS